MLKIFHISPITAWALIETLPSCGFVLPRLLKQLPHCFAWGCGGYIKRQLSLRTSHQSCILNKMPMNLNLSRRGDTSRLLVGDLMSLNGLIPVSVSLVPNIVLNIFMIYFVCFTYCGRWDVKVWHKGKPKSGYLLVSIKQETTSLAHKISRDPSSTHEK